MPERYDEFYAAERAEQERFLEQEAAALRPEAHTPGRFHLQRAKINGKWRELCIPLPETRKRHHEMLDYLYSLETDWPAGTCGSIPGRGVLYNAEQHINNGSRYFYQLDLKDAFKNVNIYTLLEATGQIIPPEQQQMMDDFIFQYVANNRVSGLALGLPDSPHLFGIYYRPLDRVLMPLCAQKGIVCTRFFDDFTFSSRDDVFSPQERREKRELIESYPGAIINPYKTKVHDLAHDDKAITITGISFYPDGKIGLAPKLKRHLNNISAVVPRVINGELEPRAISTKQLESLCHSGLLFSDGDKVICNKRAFSIEGRRQESGFIEWALSTLEVLRGYRSLINGLVAYPPLASHPLVSDTEQVRDKVQNTIESTEKYLYDTISERVTKQIIEFGTAIMPDDWSQFLENQKKIIRSTSVAERSLGDLALNISAI
ncbi:reverse transcriptase domain-containing protein [Candidatus Saccharibacteria bacterium]|nr:reverse transcriptase domain-containing protein [Candidatus Saccharibacteria bacterium]